LLTPPVKGLTVLGFDPAFRTGCKLAVVDQTGKFLAKEVIYAICQKLLNIIFSRSINIA